MLSISRRLARIAKRRIRRLHLRYFNRIHLEPLQEAVRDVVPQDTKGLFVHSSLGSCGYFLGGCEMIVRTLRERADDLCMPTHTYCYPTDENAIPPIFDPHETPSLVGALTDCFWKMDGVLRSLHPTHSVAAIGPLAPFLIAGHELCDTPCGDGTPYKKMIDADFSVLMLGATLNAYTFFHTAEHDARVPYLYFPKPYDLRVRDPSNREITVRMLRQNMTVPRRFAAMDKELEAEGLLRRAPLGCGEILCIMSSKSAHEFLVETLRHDPYHLVHRR